MWHGRDHKSTIDLVLAREELTTSTIKCVIHGTEHRPDHRAIETVFDVSVPLPKHQEQLQLKNAPWKEINTRIAGTLNATLTEGTVQQKTDVTILTLGYSLGLMVHVGCGQGGNKIVCRCTVGKLNDVTVVLPSYITILS